MKIIDVEQNTKEWEESRLGKITGSVALAADKKRGGEDKVLIYKMIADKIAFQPTDENRMERGHRLEEKARKLISETTAQEFLKQGIWVSDDEDRIAVSPDGATEDHRYACEIKSLENYKHLMAILEPEVPKEYWPQVMQHFVVNEKLEGLYFCFYNPCFKWRELVIVYIDRQRHLEEIARRKNYQLEFWERVDTIVKRLTF